MGMNCRRLFFAGWSILVLIPAATAAAEPPLTDETPLPIGGKLRFHALSVGAPEGFLKTAAYAGALHWMGVPDEWRRGAAGYGKRLASAVGDTAIRHTLAFGMDTALGQDPRYFRARSHGLFARLGHAMAAVAVARSDAGREVIATSRLTSAFGAAFLSNQWYPDRLNTAGQGFLSGGIILGFDAAGNMLSEFLPDLKKLVRHKR